MCRPAHVELLPSAIQGLCFALSMFNADIAARDTATAKSVGFASVSWTEANRVLEELQLTEVTGAFETVAGHRLSPQESFGTTPSIDSQNIMLCPIQDSCGAAGAADIEAFDFSRFVTRTQEHLGHAPKLCPQHMHCCRQWSDMTAVCVKSPAVLHCSHCSILFSLTSAGEPVCTVFPS